MNENIKETLLGVGLTGKEADVYLALLQQGTSAVTVLAKKIKLERRTIYDVLDKLILKGFAGSFIEQGTKVYSAVEPHTVLADLERRKVEFAKTMPKLQSLQIQPETEVVVLKGRRGYISILDDIVHRKMKHYSFGMIEDAVHQLQPELNHYLRALKDLGLEEEVIFEEGSTYSTVPKGKYRILDKKLVPPTAVVMYGDVVALFLNDDAMTIIKITDKHVFDAYLVYFKTFWAMGKPLVEN